MKSIPEVLAMNLCPMCSHYTAEAQAMICKTKQDVYLGSSERFLEMIGVPNVVLLSLIGHL